jgi:hypothetical protein
VLLARTASNLEQARELLSRGVAAGERTVGPRTFVQDVGHSWLVSKRARIAAARIGTLWRLDWRAKAVDHQRELLRLNPNDNRELRNPAGALAAAGGMLRRGRRVLAANAEEAAPGVVYSRALAAFRRRRRRRRSPRLLAEAPELHLELIHIDRALSDPGVESGLPCGRRFA